MPLYKNTANQKIPVYAWDSGAGEPKTGDAAQITAQISKDGGATAATDDTNPTELDATDAPGIYLFDMTQAETNGNLVILSAVSSTSGIHIEPVIIFTDIATRDVNVVQISGDATAADNCELMFDGTGYAGGSTKLDVNVASQANIDFGATQKTSLQAAVLADRAAANTELAAIPTTTSGWGTMVQFLFEYFRNKREEVAATETLYKEDASTPLGTRTLSDDGTTFTRGEMS